MQLKPFLLDMWLAAYEHDIEFNLASSEGPRWTLNKILSLASEEERQRFLNHTLAYSRPEGADGLRAAIADMHDVDVETVQVVTGASEALVILMWMAAEAGANVVLPQPGYPRRFHMNRRANRDPSRARNPVAREKGNHVPKA